MLFSIGFGHIGCVHDDDEDESDGDAIQWNKHVKMKWKQVGSRTETTV